MQVSSVAAVRRVDVLRHVAEVCHEGIPAYQPGDLCHFPQVELAHLCDSSKVKERGLGTM